LNPSELRTLSCAFDANRTSIVACAEYALALLHCRRAARGHAADLQRAARHAQEAARWLDVAPVGDVAGGEFNAALARLEQALLALARELEARGAKAPR
jgi:hypothetical protein